MPKVKFRVPFVTTDGTRYRKGVQDVAEKHMSILPSTAKKLTKAEVKAEADVPERPPEKGAKVKQYKSIPAKFRNEDTGANIDKAEAIKSAYGDFLATGSTLDDWNNLADKERKERIETAAREILATL